MLFIFHILLSITALILRAIEIEWIYQPLVAPETVKNIILVRIWQPVEKFQKILQKYFGIYNQG